jgi:uncharacterized protein YndB with AHSA1/START domain
VQPAGCTLSRVERAVLLPAPPDDVWRALSDPAELSEWFGATVALELRPGGRAVFRFPDGVVRRAAVELVVPQRSLVLRWLPFEVGPDGHTRPVPPARLEFSLRADDSGTRLVVREDSPEQAAR